MQLCLHCLIFLLIRRLSYFRDLCFTAILGEVIVKLHPEWAPLGVKRIKELTAAKFWDGCHAFRVVPKFMVQLGINGEARCLFQTGRHAAVIIHFLLSDLSNLLHRRPQGPKEMEQKYRRRPSEGQQYAW